MRIPLHEMEDFRHCFLLKINIGVQYNMIGGLTGFQDFLECEVMALTESDVPVVEHVFCPWMLKIPGIIVRWGIVNQVQKGIFRAVQKTLHSILKQLKIIFVNNN